jgi:phosphate/sulfate permease
MGAILANGSNTALADGATKVAAFMNGLHHALYIAAVIAFVGALTALVTVRSHARSRSSVEHTAPGTA